MTAIPANVAAGPTAARLLSSGDSGRFPAVRARERPGDRPQKEPRRATSRGVRGSRGRPGPNLRSRFTDTEQVEDAVTEQFDGNASRFCPSCHRVLPSTELVCTADGTELVVLPPPAGT
jgi:hypothetical protein